MVVDSLWVPPAPSESLLINITLLSCPRASLAPTDRSVPCDWCLAEVVVVVVKSSIVLRESSSSSVGQQLQQLEAALVALRPFQLIHLLLLPQGKAAADDVVTSLLGSHWTRNNAVGSRLQAHFDSQSLYAYYASVSLIGKLSWGLWLSTQITYGRVGVGKCNQRERCSWSFEWQFHAITIVLGPELDELASQKGLVFMANT